MAETVIKPLHWNMILDGIHERSCVPFLGAAVNIANAQRSYDGLPLGGEVALRLVESLIGKKVGSVHELVKISDISEDLTMAGLAPDLLRFGLENLSRVALHLEVQGGERPYLVQQLRHVLAESTCQPSKLLTCLAELPFRLLITTNFDRLMERALEAAFERSLPINASEILNVDTLMVALARADPLSLYLRSQLSGELAATVENYDPSQPLDEEVAKRLAQGLTAIITGPLLYTPQRFSSVPLTEELRSRLEKQTAGTQLIYLNRLLLEEAYPFALAKCRKPHRVVVQPKDGFKGNEQKQQLTEPPPDDVLVVYKIHGSFSDPATPADKDASDVVLTEEDYIRFLTVIGQPGAGVPKYVSSKLVHSRLLFLGYSLEDWDFRTLYKALIETLPRDDRRTAFAIQWRPPKFWVDYWEKKQVIIYDYDVYRFAEELEVRYIKKFGRLGAAKN